VKLGVIFAVVFTAMFWIVGSYTRLARLRTGLLDVWRAIDVQLKRRHDVVPNLVNAVRASAAVDRDALSAVMNARASALTATGPADAARKEARLAQAIARLLGATDADAALASSETVRALRDELSAVEQKVGVAGRSYNDVAARFNMAQRTFPSNVFAAFGFAPAERFEADGRG
jgi:LemA protein